MGTFFFAGGEFRDADICPGCGESPCTQTCAVGAAERILATEASDGESRITCGGCGTVVVNRRLRVEDHLDVCPSLRLVPRL